MIDPTAHESAPLSTTVAILAAMLLVLGNALFVAAEFALVRVRPGRLRELARAGNRRAERAHYLVQHLNEALSVCQVGITLTSLALGWLGEPAFGAIFSFFFSPLEPWFGAVTLSLSIGSAFLFITFLHVVLGELVPKTFAILLAEKVALAVALPLRFFWIASWPLVAVLNGSANLLMRPFVSQEISEAAAHGRDEIRQLLLTSLRQGRIGRIEAKLVDNLFNFARRRTRSIMIPRARIAAIDIERPLAESLQLIREEGYSRYPLIRGDLDRVIGIVHVKDIFRQLAADAGSPDLRSLARKPVIVPETMPVDRLLRQFQIDRTHMAIVSDEYGGTAGIATLEDVLEEIVGELRDEFDDDEVDPVRIRPGGGWVLDPLLPFDRAAELVDDPPEAPEGVNTVAGFIQHGLGRVPEAGDRVPFGPDHELVAAVVQGASVLQVEMIEISPPPAAAG
jgi:CBS domain containing-hemolysin-like protein